jgi:hypothetical protein
MTALVALEEVKQDIENLSTSKTITVEEAFTKAISIIQHKIDTIKEADLAKLLALGEKFDENHMNYSVISQRGHVGAPTEYHKYLSMFSTQDLMAAEVFHAMDDDHKEQILVDVVKDKGMNEQLVAYRHGFEFITHTKGHDGINSRNEVFEVKNHAYSRPKNDGRFTPCIKFDRLSTNNLRKLDEGRPTIILNSTDGHKLLIEMKLEFTDELVQVYKERLKGVTGKDTSGTSISFVDYKDAIRDVTFISDDFEDYNFSLSLLEFLNDNYNTSFSTKRKSTLNPDVQKVLKKHSSRIKDEHSNGSKLVSIAKGLSSPKLKISPTHVKRVLNGEF